MRFVISQILVVTHTYTCVQTVYCNACVAVQQERASLIMSELSWANSNKTKLTFSYFFFNSAIKNQKIDKYRLIYMFCLLQRISNMRINSFKTQNKFNIASKHHISLNLKAIYDIPLAWPWCMFILCREYNVKKFAHSLLNKVNRDIHA